MYIKKNRKKEEKPHLTLILKILHRQKLSQTSGEKGKKIKSKKQGTTEEGDISSTSENVPWICTSREDSNQTALSRSLIRIFSERT